MTFVASHFPPNEGGLQRERRKTGGKCVKSNDSNPRSCACGNPIAPWGGTCCRECNRAASKRHYQKTKARQNARRAEWHRKNIERARAYARSRPKVNRYKKKNHNTCACGRDAVFSVECKSCRAAKRRRLAANPRINKTCRVCGTEISWKSRTSLCSSHYMRDYSKSRREVINKQRKLRYPEVKEKHNQALKKKRDELKDGYVRSVLARRSTLSTRDIPQPLVELKREQIKLIRLCRTSQTSTN